MDVEKLLAEKEAIIAHKEAIIAQQEVRNSHLEAELSELKRLIFGYKSERFIPENPPEQLSLDLGVEAAKQEAEPVGEEKEHISYSRKKSTPQNATHPGRKPLPDHLPRKTIIIEPDVDTSQMLKIGEEVTEILEIQSAKLFVTRIVRSKYVNKQAEEGEKQLYIGSQPEGVIPRCMAGTSLLVHILISKYCDHLPLYRQQKIFKREGVVIPSSTLSDWVAAIGQLLEPLYQKLRREVLKQEYLMADESRMQVQDQSKSGKTYRGFMWLYYAPLIKLVLFEYQKGRGKQYPRETLKDFSGYLQTDGYEVYDSLFGKKKGITLLGCMAHARRYFEKALQQDKIRASHALTRIQELYTIERMAKEEAMDFEKRLTLRQEKALLILRELKKWALEQYPEVLPKSLIGKAIKYYLQREEKLSRYIQDGRLEIDNNYVENSIRPLALGRKNYLFAGSHKATQHAAIIYSFIGSCEKVGIEPGAWLTDVIERIPNTSIQDLDKLLPHQWEPVNRIQT
ncbi:MAG: IS66 family transposase [Bacteroidota bacterium]